MKTFWGFKIIDKTEAKAINKKKWKVILQV